MVRSWKSLLFSILLIQGSFEAQTLANESNSFWVYGSESVSQPHLFGSSALQFAPRIGADLFGLASGWSLGVEFSKYTVPGGLGIGRTDSAFQAGYWFMNQRIGVLAQLGTTSNSLGGYSNSADTLTGFGVKYRVPLVLHTSFFIGANWNNHSSFEFERDTGKPVTNSVGLNALCSFVTFGVANNCGDKMQTVSIPSMTAVDLSLGFAFVF